MKNILKVDRMHGYLIVTNGKLSCSDEKDEQYMPLIKYLAFETLLSGKPIQSIHSKFLRYSFLELSGQSTCISSKLF